MKKFILASLLLFSLNLLADRIPATGVDPNDNAAKSVSTSTEDVAKTDAGMLAAGPNCASCKALSTSGRTKRLDNTNTIFRGGSVESSSSSATTSEKEKSEK